MDSYFRNMFSKLNITKGEKFAFFSTIIAGLIAHAYMFANKIPNHDDMHYAFDEAQLVADVYDFNSRIGLPFFASLSGTWSIPWLNGILSLMFIALSAVVVVRILSIKTNVCAALIGILMVTFPTVTGTFSYMMTADTYFLCLLFVCIAALLLTKKGRIPYILSIVFFTASISIYQAYLTFGLALFVAYIIKEYYKEKNFKNVILQLVKLGSSAVVSLVTYYALVYLMDAMGTRMPNASVLSVFSLIRRLFFGLSRLFSFYILDTFRINHAVFPWLFIASTVLVAILLGRLLSKCKLKGTQWIVMLGLFAVFICSMAALYLIVTETIHALMIYSFLMLPIAYVMIIDESADVFADQKLTRSFGSIIIVCCILIGACCWDYTIAANQAYLQLDISYRQVYAYSNRLVERIETVEGYQLDLPVVFIGAPNIQQDNEEFYNTMWGPDAMAITGFISPTAYLSNAATAYRPLEEFLSQYIGWHHVIYRQYPPYNETYNGTAIPYDDLAIYPANGSIKVIDGVICVRFQ